MLHCSILSRWLYCRLAVHLRSLNSSSSSGRLKSDCVWIPVVVCRAPAWWGWRSAEARAAAYQRVLCTVALLSGSYLALMVNNLEWRWGITSRFEMKEDVACWCVFLLPLSLHVKRRLVCTIKNDIQLRPSVFVQWVWGLNGTRVSSRKSWNCSSLLIMVLRWSLLLCDFVFSRQRISAHANRVVTLRGLKCKLSLSFMNMLACSSKKCRV